MNKWIGRFLIFIVITSLVWSSVSAQWMLSDDGITLVLTNEEGELLKGFSRDYEIQVQVDAATPEGIKTLGHYRIKRSGFWILDTTRSVIKLGKLNMSIDKEKRYGLRISIWIIDRKNKILYRGFGSTLISQNDLNGASKRIPIKIVEEDVLPKHEGWYTYKWETIESWEARDYMKVPILIIDNRKGKGRLQSSIALEANYKTQFSATLAYGVDLSVKFKNSNDPVNVLSTSVKIYGKEWIPIEGSYYFYRAVDVPAGSIGYIYILGKPYYRHEKEYLCAWGMGSYSCTPTGKERIDVGIYDVKAKKGTNGYLLEGGYEIAPPRLDSIFYEFTEEGFHYYLTSGEGVSLKYLLRETSGECGIQFGVGIPVGAIAVLFGAPAPVAGLVASLQYEKAGKVSIDGGVQNFGSSVNIHAFRSSQPYTFKAGLFNSCSVQVPTGLYIKAE